MQSLTQTYRFLLTLPLRLGPKLLIGRLHRHRSHVLAAAVGLVRGGPVEDEGVGLTVSLRSSH